MNRHLSLLSLLALGFALALAFDGVTAQLPNDAFWYERFPGSDPSAFPGRESHALAVLDEDNILVCGGRGDDDQPMDDAWIYTGGSNIWRQQASMPEPRYGHTAVPVTVNGLTGILVFGGVSTNEVVLNSLALYTWDTNAWTVVEATSTSGDLPNARLDHAATMNFALTKMYIHAGWDLEFAFFDMWELNIETATWNKLVVSSAQPANIAGHSLNLVYSNNNDFLYLFGGWNVLDDQYLYSNSLWYFDTAASVWVLQRWSGDGPTTRAYHASSFFKNQLVVHGGLNATHRVEDGWSYNIDTGVWSPLPTIGTPPPATSRHVAVGMPEVFVLVGGKTSPTATVTSDLYTIELPGSSSTNWALISLGAAAGVVGLCVLLFCRSWYNRQQNLRVAIANEAAQMEQEEEDILRDLDSQIAEAQTRSLDDPSSQPRQNIYAPTEEDPRRAAPQPTVVADMPASLNEVE